MDNQDKNISDYERGYSRGFSAGTKTGYDLGYLYGQIEANNRALTGLNTTPTSFDEADEFLSAHGIGDDKVNDFLALTSLNNHESGDNEYYNPDHTGYSVLEEANEILERYNL